MPWAAPFALVLGILLVRNAWLFSSPGYEDADMAAYSIQIEQARRWVEDPSLPAGVERIAAAASGAGAVRYAVLAIARHNAWPAVTGILVQAERSGVPACVAGRSWEFMMTSTFICTRKELAAGARFSVWVPGSVPRGMPVVFRLRRGVVTNGPK